jgi:hypothetical protein
MHISSIVSTFSCFNSLANYHVLFVVRQERCKEFDRARVIYRYALEHLVKEEVSESNSYK